MKRVLLCILMTSILSVVFVPTALAISCTDPLFPKSCDGETCVSKNVICLNLKYPTFPGAPNINAEQDITAIVAWFYVFIVGISGLAAFVMIVYGGVKWMISQGNPGQITEAQDIIKSALFGILLVLSSFLILQIINPELTILQAP